MKYPLLLLFFFCCSASYSQTNYAIRLNGTNQYAEIFAPIPSNSSYTKEAWVYSAGTGGSQNIISSANAPFWISGSTLSAGHGGNYTQVTDGTAFSTSRWVHVAVTYDAGTTTMKLYRDGILVNTNTSVANNYTSENTFIGSHTGGNSLINASIDEVRIWSIARTQEEIRANMFRRPSDTEPGLLAAYHCDESAGTTLINATGGTNGNLINAPVWIASPVLFNGNALSFDGLNDQVIIPHSVSSDFTLEYWVRTTATSGGGTQWFQGSGIVDAEVGGDTYDWGTSLLGSKLAFGIGNPGSDRTAISVDDINTGNWVHVAVSWRQSTGEVKMYINGTDQGVFPATSTALRSAPPRIALGSTQPNIQFFAGTLDDVRIWNVVRTQSQIQANMTRELQPAFNPSLVAYYTFDQGISSGTNTGLNTIYDLKGNNYGVMNNFALTGTSSNFVTQNNTIILLPLEWISFTAKQAGSSRQIRLDWTTGSELNTKDFLIQHSTNGSNWSNIASIPATGANNAKSDYSFIHKDPAEGGNYYRIFQRDLDNNGSYSPTRMVDLKNIPAALTILNSRVASGMLHLRLAAPSVISVFDTGGRLMLKTQLNGGDQMINISQLAKGVYIVTNGNESKKILIE
ncbi:MAG: T9SS type A sorting domain-containing protein [Sphingobacteriales bacterium]|nr:T9SS type A sorting domain-containing protein [Sphingobacteriales bacterium]OJV99536.1 MAG: hypothetical protein BGO52_12875 [Sphingobacteriales bacterium 44-61]